MAPSPSGQSESEKTTICFTEDDSLSGAEDNVQSPQRRRKARMNEVDEATQLRRRAQNRDSQQAYRQRKEEYIQGLQGQIVDLHLRHRDLWQSYLSQGRRVGLLREVAADLGSEIATLRQRQGQPSPPASERMLASAGNQSYAQTANTLNVAQQTTLCANMISGTAASTQSGNERMGIGSRLQVPNRAPLERKLHRGSGFP